MPYVSIKLDDANATALAEAAANIASGSAFVAKTYAHLTLLGSLHTYEDDAVHVAVSGLVPTEPIHGRFLSWGISKHGSLQVLVECAPALSQLQEALHSMLPRGRPWANSQRWVTVGSVKAIPEAQHAEFLKAVEASYPITQGSVFTLSSLFYEKDVQSVMNARPSVKARQGRKSAARSGPTALDVGVDRHGRGAIVKKAKNKAHCYARAASTK
jgi:hypothetical protein